MPEGRPSIAIVGSGAMGSVFAARLAHGGADVLLLDADERLVRHLNDHGLHLDGPEGAASERLPAAATADGRDPVDGVFFFVKCQHTAAAAELARPLVGPDSTVVSLQNGWGNGDTLAAAHGPDRLVVGVTYISATSRGPGDVAYRGAGPTHVGAWNDAGAAHAERVAAWLRAGGLDVDLAEDVRTQIWRKLVLNAATLPTAALTGLSAGALGRHPEMRGIVQEATAEAVAVGRAAGYALDLDERQSAIAAVLERAGDGKGSMLQDVEAGRRTEIDVISGAVLRAADRLGCAVPATRTLYGLVKGLEDGRGLS